MWTLEGNVTSFLVSVGSAPATVATGALNMSLIIC